MLSALMPPSGLIFRRSKKIGSKLIRWGTQENWSHIGIMFDGKVYHSDTRGCHGSTLEEFSKDAETWIVPREITEVEKSRAYFAVGDKYDWGAIIWFALSLPLRRLGIRIPELTINPRWMVCSEYAAWILWGENQTHTPGEVLARALENPA